MTSWRAPHAGSKWELCPSHFAGGDPRFLLRLPASLTLLTPRCQRTTWCVTMRRNTMEGLP